MRRLSPFATTLILLCLGTLFGSIDAKDCEAKQEIRMEILFMNHGPMQPTIRELKTLLGRYSGKVKADWFDYDQQSGKAFMRKKGITAHVPLVIYINGAYSFNTGGKQITFVGFPTGSGPYQFQGKWTFQDLDQVLGSVAGR
ncbi:MAG: hypothetical protein AB1473_08935 [Thermodesulfobacteriota bacterium]